jgi:hypothetical protein
LLRARESQSLSALGQKNRLVGIICRDVTGVAFMSDNRLLSMQTVSCLAAKFFERLLLMPRAALRDCSTVLRVLPHLGHSLVRGKTVSDGRGDKSKSLG